MHLSNFTLVTDASAHGWLIALNAHGLEWDLHNFADFEGFDYRSYDYSAFGDSTRAISSSLTIYWRLGERIIKWRDTGNQYGIPNYPSDCFRLVFSDVDYFEVTPRDPAMPTDEDRGISSISFIEAGEDLKEYIDSGAVPVYIPSGDEETLSCHMMFRFNGGQIIRVGAKTAEFVLVSK